MKKDGYYSSGEFAKMADVTLRTIRYYDRQNLLKPSYVNEHGARFYTDSDFVKLFSVRNPRHDIKPPGPARSFGLS